LWYFGIMVFWFYGLAVSPGALLSPGVLGGEFKIAKLQNAKCKRDERCRWCSLGVRAVPVVQSWVLSSAGRCGGLARRTSFAGHACWEGPGFRAVPVGLAWGKSLIFFCLDAKETKSSRFNRDASFLTGKSQADDDHTVARIHCLSQYAPST
jgi:hypothetical protein